jgi:hypothetical protein
MAMPHIPDLSGANKPTGSVIQQSPWVYWCVVQARIDIRFSDAASQIQVRQSPLNSTSSSADGKSYPLDENTEWSAHWLKIAKSHAESAARSRARSSAGTVNAPEFHASLVSITASARAIEAIQLKTLGSRPRCSGYRPKWQIDPRGKRRTNAGDRLGQALLERNAIDQPTADALGELVDLCKLTVHPVTRSAGVARDLTTDQAHRDPPTTFDAKSSEFYLGVAQSVIAALFGLDPGAEASSGET